MLKSISKLDEKILSQASGDKYKNDGRVAHSKNDAELEPSDPRFKACVQEIRNLMPPYKNIIASKILLKEGSHDGALTYIVEVRGDGVHYCNNLVDTAPERDPNHSSNRVFFTIAAKGVRQKCHKCKDYAMEPRPLQNKRNIITLFPEDCTMQDVQAPTEKIDKLKGSLSEEQANELHQLYYYGHFYNEKKGRKRKRGKKAPLSPHLQAASSSSAAAVVEYKKLPAFSLL